MRGKREDQGCVHCDQTDGGHAQLITWPPDNMSPLCSPFTFCTFFLTSDRVNSRGRCDYMVFRMLLMDYIYSQTVHVSMWSHVLSFSDVKNLSRGITKCTWICLFIEHVKKKIFIWLGNNIFSSLYVGFPDNIKLNRGRDPVSAQREWRLRWVFCTTAW